MHTLSAHDCYAGLSCLVSLMELYCGGNNVKGVREVGHLRGLLKLIILDLTGNPMAAHDDYRLYTVYHLRKLKVGNEGGDCIEHGSTENFKPQLCATGWSHAHSILLCVLFHA